MLGEAQIHPGLASKAVQEGGREREKGERETQCRDSYNLTRSGHRRKEMPGDWRDDDKDLQRFCSGNVHALINIGLWLISSPDPGP